MTTLLARRVVRTHAVMGTMASVHVHDQVDDASVDAAIEATWSELDRLEEIFSTFRSIERDQSHQSRRAPSARCVAGSDRSRRRMHVAGTRQ